MKEVAIYVVRVAIDALWDESGNSGIRSLTVEPGEQILDPWTWDRPLDRISGGERMRSIIRGLRISSLKAQIEASRLHCTSLVREFENAPTDAAKTVAASRYDEALRQTHSLQLLLELLERKERESSNAAQKAKTR